LNKNNRIINFEFNKDSYSIKFNAMASPCELIVQTDNKELALRLGKIVSDEVWRIEDKYSRYDDESLCSAINCSEGKSTPIDEETFLLLNFAEHCYQLSDGFFDISSGILRKVWSFNNDDVRKKIFPSKEKIKKVLAYVGWSNIQFDHNQITLTKGMEIDFGGLGKEYAVDRCIILAKQVTDSPVLVNFGGDLAVTGPRSNNQSWQVAIESPDIEQHKNNAPDMIISLKSGALATSGDSKRFLLNDGKRYGHILNAKTGWPIEKAPRSITVIAPQCIQAGVLATTALLQGSDAETFLTDQEVKFWARR
jgi:thiamine biosynthesis lipoprotein